MQPLFPDPDHGKPAPSQRLWGYGVTAWSTVYMLPHFYWALGGRFGLSVFHPSVAQLPQLREINWWATLILAAAALLGIALIHLRSSRRFRWPLLAIAWSGASAAVAHGLYGIASRGRTVLQLAASPAGLDLEKHGWLLWDLCLFEPWFLVEGILIVLAGWHHLEAPDRTPRWLLACVVGICMALATAVAGLRLN